MLPHPKRQIARLPAFLTWLHDSFNAYVMGLCANVTYKSFLIKMF